MGSFHHSHPRHITAVQLWLGKPSAENIDFSDLYCPAVVYHWHNSGFGSDYFLHVAATAFEITVQ